ncbi:hypothetical protein Tco_0053712 [Tanacetum coccineum]
MIHFDVFYPCDGSIDDLEVLLIDLEVGVKTSPSYLLWIKRYGPVNVSKILQSASQIEENQITQIPSLSSKVPWFVAQTPQDQIFYTIRNPLLLYRYQVPKIIGTQIRACFHGWVVLSKHPTWFLWNPLTLKVIRLPPSIHMKEPDQCCLSSRHDDPSSVFFLTTHMNPTLTFCWLDSIRNKLKWAKFSYAKELRRIIGKTCYLFDLTCCNGKLYAFNSLQGDASVIEIDIAVKEQKVVIRLLPFMEHPGFSFNRFSQTNGSKDFDRYLKGNMIWEKMEDLKNAIFFIQVDSQYPVYYRPIITTELAVPTGGMSSWGMLECRLGGGHVNLKQEEDKDDGNIVVKSGDSSKLNLPDHRYQDYQYKDCQGRLLARFQDDAKYKHVGQDTRSQGGNDDKEKQGKDLKISEPKTKSKRQ